MQMDMNIALSDETLSAYSKLVRKVSGIHLSNQKKGMLTSRLLKRLHSLGIRDYRKYLHYIKNNDDELVEMLNCISTNTTNFFRESHHFDYLRDRVMAYLVRAHAADRTIRIWSAGCSTGEEPYSIAITVLEALNRHLGDGHRGWDIRILATDLSTRVLDTAQKGIYRLDQIEGHVSTDLLMKYFLKGSGEYGGMVKTKDTLRDIVSFRRLNFKEERYPFNRNFDVIFCRNVMIYFEEDMKSMLLERFHSHLADDGYLFLGHSESMFKPALFKPVSTTTYIKL